MQIQLTVGSKEAAKNCGDGMAVALTAAACRDNGSSMEVDAARISGRKLVALPQVLRHKNFCPPKKSKNETYERRYRLNWTTALQKKMTAAGAGQAIARCAVPAAACWHRTHNVTHPPQQELTCDTG